MPQKLDPPGSKDFQADGSQFDSTRHGPVTTVEAIHFTNWRRTNLTPSKTRTSSVKEAEDREETLTFIFTYVSPNPWELTVDDLLDAALAWPTDSEHGFGPKQLESMKRRLRSTVDELHELRPQDIRPATKRSPLEMDTHTYNGLMLLLAVEAACIDVGWDPHSRSTFVSTIRTILREQFDRVFPTAVLDSQTLQEIDGRVAADTSRPHRHERWRLAIRMAHARDADRLPAPWLENELPPIDAETMTVGEFLNLLRDEQRLGQLEPSRASNLISTVERVIAHSHPTDALQQTLSTELLVESARQWQLDAPDVPASSPEQVLKHFRSAVRIGHYRRSWQVPDPFTTPAQQPVRTLRELERVPLRSAGLANVAYYVEPSHITTERERVAWHARATAAVTACLDATITSGPRHTWNINDGLVARVETSDAPDDAKLIFKALFDASREIGRVQTSAAAERAAGTYRDDHPRFAFEFEEGAISIATISGVESSTVRAHRRRARAATSSAQDSTDMSPAHASGHIDSTRPDIVTFELG